MEELPTGAVYGCLLMPAKIQKVECLVNCKNSNLKMAQTAHDLATNTLSELS